MNFDTPRDFAVSFYTYFIHPLIVLLDKTELMGFSLLSWLLGLSVCSLAVAFFRTFLGFDNDKKG